MTTISLLRSAVATAGFSDADIPGVQSRLIDLFTRCGDDTTVAHCRDGVARVFGGVVERRFRDVTLAFLGTLDGERLIRDVREELAQDLDMDVLTTARSCGPLSVELAADATLLRATSFLVLTAQKAREFAADLDAKAVRAHRLEQRVATLEAQLRQITTVTFARAERSAAVPEGVQ